MSFLIFILLSIIALWLVSILFMRGENLDKFDRDNDPGAVRRFAVTGGSSEEHENVVESIKELYRQGARLPKKKRLDFMRNTLEDMSAGREYASEFVAVDAGGVPAEWVLAPGVNFSKRVLYIHGGAFIAGSRRSHRNITDHFSEISGAAVLAIDYRLMPEHRRGDGISDCRRAYRWILENGPDGPGEPTQLVVSGDSAGGNLSLSLAAWVRDEGLHAADVIVAFSPTVDAGYSSPSIRRNVASDILLGPIFGALLKVPRAVMAWLYLFQFRYNPANPLVSPVLGDLSNLPPTLIQASEAEMLLDDALRYVRKARASGSVALAQTWPHMLHVWQMFCPEMPEAKQAFQEVRQFLDAVNKEPDGLDRFLHASAPITDEYSGAMK